jgi:alpha/beta superfamily hydrolase
VRDDVGQVLNYPLNPCAYFLGPFSIVATAAFYINNSTYLQPLIKKVELSYADPYELIREADGVGNYIKNSNLDRKDVFDKKTSSENIVPINNVGDFADLKPDVKFSDFNPQSPLIDAMRTTLFDNRYQYNNTIWADVSLWNKGFDKQLKTACVKIYGDRDKYRYRYILQKDKNAPVAVIFPSIGEGILGDKSVAQSKLLYEEGYSVVILGSTCNWEFIKSMPKGYSPGLPNSDAKYLRFASAKVLADVQSKHGCNFSKKIVVGTSFGALTGLFVAAHEANENTLNVSHYISINPPVETFFAINQVDKFAQEWKNDPSDLKARAAVTVEKVLQKTQEISDKRDKGDKGDKNLPTYFSFSDDEAKLILGFCMKQKLYDLVFTIENGSTSKKNKILYDTINSMSFNDYAQKYLYAKQEKPASQVDYEASLYSISNFLQNSKNYKIYHSVDDYYANPQQLAWLKKQAGDKALYFSNGSHLGELYRQEFIDDFKKEIRFKNNAEIMPEIVQEIKPSVQPIELTAQPAVKITDKPVRKSIAKPVEHMIGRPTLRPAVKPIGQQTVRPAEQPVSEVKHER